MSDIYRKETISFRFVDLPDELVPFLKEALDGIELEVKRRKGGKELVVAFVLNENKNYEKLCTFIQERRIPASQYGLWISLVTEADNGGVHVPAYAIDLLRHIGGQLDFSFVSV
jgi:hypothetical protein